MVSPWGREVSVPPRDEWVMLCYRLPREPSTPRVVLWRRLVRLGVAQLADGLVALPADARTREQLDWLAESVREHGGEASVWLSCPASAADEETVRAGMTATIAAEYRRVRAEATAARDADPAARGRLAARLRRELHRIGQRDYFPTTERDAARVAVESLARPAHSCDGERLRR